MSRQTINNGESGSVVRTKLNDNFTELYTHKYFPVVIDATAARTFGLSDSHKYVRFTSAGAVNATVPPQSSVAWEDDAEIIIRQAGAGQVTVVAGAGVSLPKLDTKTLTTVGQGATVTLKRVAENVWDIAGELASA